MGKTTDYTEAFSRIGDVGKHTKKYDEFIDSVLQDYMIHHVPLKEVSRKCALHYQTVLKWMQDLNIDTDYFHGLYKERTYIQDSSADQIRSLVKKGNSFSKVAEQMGLSIGTVSKKAKQEGIEAPRWGGYNKLSDTTTQAIVDLHDEGISGKEIARCLGISSAAVSKYTRQFGTSDPYQEHDGMKRCRGCEVDKPITDFPFRYDRHNKRHAKCFSCRNKEIYAFNQRAYYLHRESIIAQKREYSRLNPEKMRAFSRLRRERKSQVRTEKYTDQEIWDRCQNICHGCGLEVDPSLRYPDRMAGVIDHIQPLAKRGPGIKKNLALMHNKCNASKKDKFECPFNKGWTVEQIEHKLAQELLIKNHYLHRRSNISFAFGLFDLDHEIRGVVAFGSPPSFRITKSVVPEGFTSSVICLNRLWIDDNVPFGAGSWFISRALRQLPPRIVISYADLDILDSRYETSHDGAIYRSLSFNFAGTTKVGSEYRLPGSSRNSGKIEGATKVKLSPKNRYWTSTGSARQKRALRELCRWPSLEPLSEPSIG